MNGIVQGGWPFVWAAYVVTAVIFGGYAVRTILAARAAERRADYERS